MLIAFAAVPLVIWIYLLFGRGWFWRVSKQMRPMGLPFVEGREVVAAVPARNEGDSIGKAISSLLQQQIEPPLRVVMVDDASTDGTADAARAAAEELHATEQLVVLKGQPLEPGWTGKLWALAQGVDRALESAPDYLLFTDADIVHAPKSVAGLIAVAEAYDCDLASYMVKLANRSFAENALIPAFVFFFLMLYPPLWIANPKARTAGAAGGCILIRPEALRRIGGIRAIRNEVIDDCSLANAVKTSGGRLWMGLTEETRSIRNYSSFREIEHLISRTAFSQLRHSTGLLVGTIAGLFITYIAPITLLFCGRIVPLVLAAAAWLLMSVAYIPMVRFYELPVWWSLALPAIAVFYAGATIHSAISYWKGKGGQWKGRIQDANR